MYFPVAQATIVGLMILAVTGCQSGGGWPWAKKEPAVSQAYPGGTTPPANYAGQTSANVQMPSAGTPPYNVGNNYAPSASTQTSGAGLYPEAAAATAATAYPGSPTSYGAGQGYGTASAYGTAAPNGGGAGSYPPAATGGTYPATSYPSATGAAAAPQDGMYGSPAAAGANGGYAASPYGAPTQSYGAPPANAYAAPAASGAYPPTASSYPTAGANGYQQAPPQSWSSPPTDPNGYAGGANGGPAAQTADSRYSRYDSSAPAASGGYSNATGSGYPATSAPASAAGTGSYQGSAYPATPASTTAPAASAPYRPGGTSDYVPTTPGGNVPSGYGATGSGVRPAGYEEPTSMTTGGAPVTAGATGGSSLTVATPPDATMPAAPR